MSVENNSVSKELMSLDVVDLLIILSIGPSRLRHLQVQKIAIILSKILGMKDIDIEPYHYGGFSETIMEKLQSNRLGEFLTRENNYYKLTKKGHKAYMLLLEKLKSRSMEELPVILEVLKRLSEDDLVTIQYFLFPEYTIESKIRKRINMLIKKYKKMGEAIIRSRDTGEEKIVEIA